MKDESSSQPASSLRDKDARWFVTTSWSNLMAAQQEGSPQATEALEKLCQTYWPPLYNYIRRRGRNATDAEDLTQAFFYQLLEKNYLGAADRARGKFRSFLLGALNHFLSNERVWRSALKRGGNRTFVSLDDDRPDAPFLAEPATSQTPESEFELQWARQVLRQAKQHLKEQYQEAGKVDVYQRLGTFLANEGGADEYAAAGHDLSMSERAVTVAVSRLRQRLGEQIRAEIARTVGDPSEVDEEVAYVATLLRQSGSDTSLEIPG